MIQKIVSIAMILFLWISQNVIYTYAWISVNKQSIYVLLNESKIVLLSGKSARYRAIPIL